MHRLRGLRAGLPGRGHLRGGRGARQVEALHREERGLLQEVTENRPLQGRRVVVTGIGAVSPNGIGREPFWAATRAERSGVRRITQFDVDHLATRIAGTVEGFDPASVMSANDLKHVPRIVPMAVAASLEAVADAGLRTAEMPVEERRRFAVVIGSGGAGPGVIRKELP